MKLNFQIIKSKCKIPGRPLNHPSCERNDLEKYYFCSTLSEFENFRETSTTNNKIKSILEKHNTYVGTVVDQNKIGQSVTLDSFTIQRFV
jgi:hypothetical protein